MKNTRIQQFVEDMSLTKLLKVLHDQSDRAQLFLVGGAVRDLLLKRSVVDIDLVVTGIAENTLENLLTKHGHAKKIGRRFGVFQFQSSTVANNQMIDIALPRTEKAVADNVGGYTEFNTDVDPSLPITDDLKRRDFTINAMAYSIGNDQLIDPFDGQSDIQNTIIRAVGNPKQRLKEDLSRMLRAVRFAVQLRFNIEKKTMHAIRLLADRINRRYDDDRFVVPREVIGKELGKALLVNPKRTLVLLYKTDLGAQLAPTLTKRLTQNPRRIHPTGDDISLTEIVAALLSIMPPNDRQTFLHMTGLNTLPDQDPYHFDKKIAKWIAKQLDRGYENPLKSKPAVFETRWMDKRGDAYKNVLRILGHERVAEAAEKREREIRETLQVRDGDIPPLVTGNDVTEMVEPGPKIGDILQEVRNKQLAGTLKNRKEALAFVKNVASADKGQRHEH